MHQFFQSTLLTFTHCWTINEKITKDPRKGIQIFIWKWLSRRLLLAYMGNKHVEANALNHWGRIKGLTMLTVVINALVQQEEMVTVIKCFYVFELTEFPRIGMCRTQNSSTNQGPRVRTLIHIMHWYEPYNVINPYYREKCSGRNEGFKVSLVGSQAT